MYLNDNTQQATKPKQALDKPFPLAILDLQFVLLVTNGDSILAALM